MLESEVTRRLTEASSLLAAGHVEDAIECLRVPEATTHGELSGGLARAYFSRGDTKGDLHAAYFFAGRALELGVDAAELRAIRAVCAFRKEQYEEAAEYFERAVTRDSGPGVQYLYALTLYQLGRYADAAGWLEHAVTQAPAEQAYLQARDQARAALTTGRPAPALGAWTRAERGLGGTLDVRPEGVPTPYRSNALSLLAGTAKHPKDLHWMAANVPCQAACPAHTDIPGYLRAIYDGDNDGAYRINLRDNVFPGVLGRVCARPCEAACRHGWEGLGESVAICASKRAGADHRAPGVMLLDPWFGPSGKSVAVVGAGPAGLAVARELVLMGHRVTVLEQHHRPGGMMLQGIPEFRLPRDVLEQEIDQVQAQGVTVRCGVTVGRDVSLAELVQAHDAVVVAAGTLRPNLLDLPGKELQGIRHGLAFLLEVNDGRLVEVGEQVIVIGGGFTAMDCARTAARLGAQALELEPVAGVAALRPKGEAVRVLYRRSKGEMLITPGELEELGHEGIPMDFMVAPVAYLGYEQGRVTGMRFVRTELGAKDASGRRRPVAVSGSEFDLLATTVLLATGQFPDSTLLEDLAPRLVDKEGWLRSGKAHATELEGVFAAGDYATGATTLIDAIAHAKDCARAVDRFLTGWERLEEAVVIADARDTGRIREMDAVPRVSLPVLPVAQRTLTAEVETGYTDGDAADEAQRCYLCHYKFEIDQDVCIYCDWCLKVKPRPDCIVKVSQLIHDDEDRIVGFERARSTDDTRLIWINQADCIRCGACVEACPVDAISLQQVSLATLPKQT